MKLAAIVLLVVMDILPAESYICTPSESHETLCNVCICSTRGRTQAWRCKRRQCDDKSEADLKKYFDEFYKDKLGSYLDDIKTTPSTPPDQVDLPPDNDYDDSENGNGDLPPISYHTESSDTTNSKETEQGNDEELTEGPIEKPIETQSEVTTEGSVEEETEREAKKGKGITINTEGDNTGHVTQETEVEGSGQSQATNFEVLKETTYTGSESTAEAERATVYTSVGGDLYNQGTPTYSEDDVTQVSGIHKTVGEQETDAATTKLWNDEYETPTHNTELEITSTHETATNTDNTGSGGTVTENTDSGRRTITTGDVDNTGATGGSDNTDGTKGTDNTADTTITGESGKRHAPTNGDTSATMTGEVGYSGTDVTTTESGKREAATGGDVTTIEPGGRGAQTAGDASTIEPGERWAPTGDVTTIVPGERGVVTAGDITTIESGKRGAVTGNDATTIESGKRGVPTDGDVTTIESGKRGVPTDGNVTTIESGKRGVPTNGGVPKDGDITTIESGKRGAPTDNDATTIESGKRGVPTDGDVTTIESGKRGVPTDGNVTTIESGKRGVPTDGDVPKGGDVTTVESGKRGAPTSAGNKTTGSPSVQKTTFAAAATN